MNPYAEPDEEEEKAAEEKKAVDDNNVITVLPYFIFSTWIDFSCVIKMF